MIVDVRTPGGNAARFVCRDGTSDAMIVRAVVERDEYRLDGRKLDGWALDVGAHVGSAAVTLALDHPGLRVVAVEPVASSARIAHLNAAANGVGERVTVDGRAAGADGGTVTVEYGYEGDEHHFVGNAYEGGGTLSDDAEAVTLSTLLAERKIADVALMKIDCEGCEWGFLADPAVGSVRTIVGELHGNPADLIALLTETHRVEIGPTGYHFAAERLS